MKRVVIFSLACMVAILGGYPNQAYPKDVIELKVTYHHSPNHLIARSIRAAYAPLEKMSGGRVKVKFYGAGALAKGKEAYDAILGGVADMGHITPAYWPGRFPLLTVGDLPGMVPNAVIGTFAINELTNTTPYIKEEFKEVKVLGWFCATPYRLLLSKKLTKVDEIKGLRLRSAGGYQSKTLEKVGASIVHMGSGEIYTSLSRGLLDGMPYPYSSIPPHRFYEMCKYAIDNLLFGSLVMGQVMNKESWAKLPPDLQEMVAFCGQNVGIYCGMHYSTDSQLAVPYLRSKGVEIYDVSAEEVEKFYAKLEPLRDEWVAEMESKGLPGRKVLNAMVEITKRHAEKWK